MRPLIQSELFLRIASPIVAGIAILGAWEIACRAYHVPSYLFPAPSAIAVSFLENAPSLLRALMMTMWVALSAFVIAVVLGTAIAFVFVQSKAVERAFLPYAIVLQVTPIVAIAPLIIILVKNTQVALILCATIIAIFPIIANTILGLRSVDHGLANLFALNKANRRQTLIRLRIPSALPYFFGGLRISSGLALIGAVVAEFVAGTGGRSAGLAYEILQAGFELAIPRMFAALFLITLAGIVLFIAMAGLSRLVLGEWHESEMAPEV
jgi:NitT/TauT family transport system permease protein